MQNDDTIYSISRPSLIERSDGKHYLDLNKEKEGNGLTSHSQFIHLVERGNLPDEDRLATLRQSEVWKTI